MVKGKGRINNVDALIKWLSNKDNVSWGYIAARDISLEPKIAGSLYVEPYYVKSWGHTNEKEVKDFQQVVEYSVKNGISFQVTYSDDKAAILKFGSTSYLIPREFVEIEYLKDYSNTPISALRDKSEKEFQITTLESRETLSGAKGKIEKKKEEIEKTQEEIKKLEEERKEELRRLEEELKIKYQKKEELLRSKMGEILEAKEKMENELFMLETEIYGIRCFMGEVIEFSHIRRGKNADESEPIIINQKIRYLDEELGKLISVYGFDGEDYMIFEDFIREREDAAELFAPGEKSISLIKISRNGVGFVSNPKNQEMLTQYKKLHGGMMGIIVRNGENVYIGWTDEEMISLNDENLYYAPKKEYHQENDDQILKNPSKEEVASRYFIFSVLQGLLYDKRIISIPEEESIMQGGGKYIIFSRTEGYLEDNRFGNFSDIMERCNVNIQEGDKILTVKTMHGEQKTYKNVRGIGDNNRTHDCRVEFNKIYCVNKVEKHIAKKVEYKYRTFTGKTEFHRSFSPGALEKHSFSSDAWVLEEIEEEIRKCYVSLEKTWSVNNARANFLLYNSEIVNLTFLNSVWVRYAIQNKKVGEWEIGGETVDYAHSIQYLNKILEFLGKREKEEETLIKEHMVLPDEWQVALSEWKLKNNVHNITAYQAKRFAKHMATAK